MTLHPPSKNTSCLTRAYMKVKLHAKFYGGLAVNRFKITWRGWGEVQTKSTCPEKLKKKMDKLAET